MCFKVLKFTILFVPLSQEITFTMNSCYDSDRNNTIFSLSGKFDTYLDVRAVIP